MQLKNLVVSGGDVSGINYKNLDGIAELKSLENLTLHEFGAVDLHPLRRMTWLKCFYCGYAKEVNDIEAVASFEDPKQITLIDLDIDSLDFLDAFPDNTVLELALLRVKKGIDRKKLLRFTNGDFGDIEFPY